MTENILRRNHAQLTVGDNSSGVCGDGQLTLKAACHKMLHRASDFDSSHGRTCAISVQIGDLELGTTIICS